MKFFVVLLVAVVIAGCGGAEGPVSDESADVSRSNAVDQKAEALHDAMDKAHDVEGQLEDKKSAIDAALEDAEGAGPD